MSIRTYGISHSIHLPAQFTVNTWQEVLDFSRLPGVSGKPCYVSKRGEDSFVTVQDGEVVIGPRDHICYYTETPDGFGCPECLYH